MFYSFWCYKSGVFVVCFVLLCFACFCAVHNATTLIFGWCEVLVTILRSNLPLRLKKFFKAMYLSNCCEMFTQLLRYNSLFSSLQLKKNISSTFYCFEWNSYIVIILLVHFYLWLISSLSSSNLLLDTSSKCCSKKCFCHGKLAIRASSFIVLYAHSTCLGILYMQI